MRATEFLKEEAKLIKTNGLTLKYAFNDRALIMKAFEKGTGNPLAYVKFVKEHDELYPQDLWVNDEYRNKGIAKTMYDALKNDGYVINRSHDQTKAGAGFWDKHRGEDAYVWEDEDVDEDMSRRGFLGALGGAAMAAAGLGAEAKPNTIKPKTKSPSQDAIQQAKKQQNVKPASPTKDPQAEAMLYRTAKASGMKGSELAQFLAQTKHESWDHSRLQEKSIGDPNQYFAKKYDPSLAPKTAKILGNKHRGDGAKYHGRGFIQLTGRDNYRMASEALGLDLLNHPEIASKPDVAAKIAVWYWNTRVKPKVNNFEDTVAVTKTINNAMFGLEDRLANFVDYKKRVA